MSIRSERIKSLIENSGKTYQELEKATGIKKSSLQRYASGTTAKIPLDVIERLSMFFNVSKEYLMGWEDENSSRAYSMQVLPVASSIGEKISLRRKELGITQEELAKRMGYTSKSTINKIELGINDISQSKIVKFAEVLATTPSYLMGYEDYIEKSAPTLTEYEQLILEIFRQIPEDQQRVFIEMGRAYANTLKKID